MTDPINKTLHVPLRPDAAFDLFTAKLADWWPTDTHSLSAVDGALPQDVEVEKRVGGHIIETKPDGETGRWGTITHWDQGRAIGISWYVGCDEDEATEVTVVFTPTDTGTRVDLTHGGFDRLGATAIAGRARYQVGWDYVLLDRFARFCAERSKLISTRATHSSL